MLRAIEVSGLHPVIDSTLGFEEAHAAYRHFVEGSGVGKVVIRG